MALYDNTAPETAYFRDPVYGQGNLFLKKNGSLTGFGKGLATGIPLITRTAGTIASAVTGIPGLGELGGALGQAEVQAGFSLASGGLRKYRDSNEGVTRSSAEVASRAQLGSMAGGVAGSLATGFGFRAPSTSTASGFVPSSSRPAYNPTAGNVQTLSQGAGAPLWRDEQAMNSLFDVPTMKAPKTSLFSFASGGVVHKGQTLNYATGGVVGVVKQPSDYKVYADGDKTEDLVIKTPDGSTYGAMRFGEYVMPQKATLIAGDIMGRKDLSADKKKQALGSIFYGQLAKNPVFASGGSFFATGGTVKPGDDIATLMAQLSQLEARQAQARERQRNERLTAQEAASRAQSERQYNALVQQARSEMSNFISRSSPLAGGLLNNNESKLKRVQQLLTQAGSYVSSAPPATVFGGTASNTSTAGNPQSVGRMASGLGLAEQKAVVDRMSVGRQVPTSEQYGRSVWGVGQQATATPPPSLGIATGVGGRINSGLALGQGLERSLQAIDEVARNRQRQTTGVGGMSRYKPETAQMQRWLNSQGATDQAGRKLAVDGIEGPLTKQAFQKYQDYAKGTQYAQSMSKPITPTGLNTVGSMQLKTGLSADLSDRVKPFSPVPTSPTATNPAPKPDLSRIGGDALDLVRAGIGASLAAKPIDMPTIPQRWMDYQSEITNRKNQGMTPAEMALNTSTIANNYRQGVSTLTNLAGGGANPGMVLSGLSNVGLQRNMATGRLLAQDAQRRDMNFARYGSVTGLTAGMESSIQNEKISRQLSDRQTGLGLAAGAMANMQGRASFYENRPLYDAYVNNLNAQAEESKEALKANRANYAKRGQ